MMKPHCPYLLPWKYLNTLIKPVCTVALNSTNINLEKKKHHSTHPYRSRTHEDCSMVTLRVSVRSMRRAANLVRHYAKLAWARSPSLSFGGIMAGTLEITGFGANMPLPTDP